MIQNPVISEGLHYGLPLCVLSDGLWVPEPYPFGEVDFQLEICTLRAWEVVMPGVLDFSLEICQSASTSEEISQAVDVGVVEIQQSESQELAIVQQQAFDLEV